MFPDRFVIGSDTWVLERWERYDEIMRELASRRYQEFEHELGATLTRVAVTETVRRFQKAGDLHWPPVPPDSK